MGQPPPTAGHRVPRGGERRPPEAAEGAARPVDRRSAPASRGEGPATRSPDPEAGRDHRDTRHDPAVAPAPDRPEVDVRAEAARSARDDEGNRVAHCPDGHGQSRVGLQSHPGRVEESRPSRREEHGRHGAERQWNPACAGPPVVLAHLSAGDWGAIAGADFFTTEVWTARGLVTYYTLF